MPANWAKFIPDVKDLILSNPESPKIFGEKLANHYVSAVTSGASSIYGQMHSNTDGKSSLSSSYGEWFEKLLTEEIDPPINDELDENGNKIPFTGKESDPEFADPDMTESEEPKIDIEKFNEFIDEYSEELDLHKFKHFEFKLNGSEDFNTVRNIIVDRLFVSLSQYNYRIHRTNFYKWVNGFGEWPYNTANFHARTRFKEDLLEGLGSTGLDAEELIKSVRWKFLTMLKSAYSVDTFSELEDAIQDTPENPIEILNKDIVFREQVIQEVYDKAKDEEDDEYNVSSILTREVIVFFTFNNTTVANSITTSNMEVWYNHNELEQKWEFCPDIESKEDIIEKTGGTLYMYTRQEMLNAMDSEDEDGKEDAYLEIAKATIKYWVDTYSQPLKKTPAAFPCIISSPLGGKYIPVYYGNKAKLAEDIRKAMNSGKESHNATESALKVAKALSLAYTRHLLKMKFVYLGGIPTPGGNVPMIGFVPNVF